MNKQKQKFEFTPALAEKLMNNPTARAMISSLQIRNFDPEAVFRSFESILYKWVDLETNFFDRVKQNVEKFTQPSIKILFSESPEEIKRQMRTTMFDIKYQGYSDQYGTWSDISEIEYAQHSDRDRFRDVRMFYVDKPLNKQ